MKNAVMSLPDDVLERVLSFLHARDLLSWRLTAKGFVSMFAGEGHASNLARHVLLELDASHSHLQALSELWTPTNQQELGPTMGAPFMPKHSPRKCLNIGHKGADGHVKGNTVASFLEAIRLGVDVIEFDVLTTADGGVICHHDPMIEETGEWIESLSLKEVRKHLPDVAVLDDVMGDERIIASGVHMYFDLKHTEVVRPVMHAVRRSVSHYGWSTDRLIVATFKQQELLVVNAFRRALPELDGLRTACIMDAVPLSLTKDFEALEVEAISVGRYCVFPNLIEDAKRRGIKVWAWTVNNPHLMDKLIAMGVDGICSDYPERVNRAMEKAGQGAQASAGQDQSAPMSPATMDVTGNEDGDARQLLGMVYGSLAAARNDAVSALAHARQLSAVCNQASAVKSFLNGEGQGDTAGLRLVREELEKVSAMAFDLEEQSEHLLRPVLTSAETFKWAMRLIDAHQGRELISSAAEASGGGQGWAAMLPFEGAFLTNLLALVK